MTDNQKVVSNPVSFAHKEAGLLYVVLTMDKNCLFLCGGTLNPCLPWS